MKRVILYREGRSILGSDGLLYIDGRFNLISIINYIKDRNKRVEKNFPHKVADGFIFCDERLNEYGKIINIPPEV